MTTRQIHRPNDLLPISVTADDARLIINTISARVAVLAKQVIQPAEKSQVGARLHKSQQFELDQLQALKIKLLGQFNIAMSELPPVVLNPSSGGSQ